MTKLIPLTQGKFATVSDRDYTRVRKHKWCAMKGRNGNFYAIGQPPTKGQNKAKKILLHRFIINAPRNKEVDHKDNNGLNCTRSNLRICEPYQNRCNMGKSTRNVTGYKGIYFRKDVSLWRVEIRIRNKVIHIGYFKDKIEAAKAYDKAAKKYHGKFAHLNFPDNKKAAPDRVQRRLTASD